MKKVSIIIVNWNGKKNTTACLSSLWSIQKQNYDVRVIVVDNGSTDGSAEFIQNRYPWVTILKTGENLGFTGGNNVGIYYALHHNCDYVWLLNNDTVVDRYALSLVHAFDDESVGASGSKIYFAPGHEYHRDRYKDHERGKVLWYAGGQVDWNNMFASHRGVNEVDYGQFDNMEETAFITGCSFMIRTSVIKSVGMLDDKLYLYLEDLDWSMRIQKAGYKTVYYPKSIVWHMNAGSTGKPGNPLQDYYLTRNRILVGFRYAPVATKLALMREAFSYIISSSPVRRKAVIDALIGKFGKQYES